VASPGELSISFAPARSTDRDFRLEFFDRYLEWDRVTADKKDYPDTPRTIIDLAVTPVPVVTSLFERTPVARVLQKVSGADTREFSLVGMQATTLSSSQPFSLTAGRPLYTGNSAPTLSYSSGGTPVILELEKYQKYVFRSNISGTISSGRAYILTPSSTEKLAYRDDMIGMPLLADTRIISGGATVDIYEPASEKSSKISPDTLYRIVPLGLPAESYTAHVSVPDGFYSARLRSLTDDQMIRAGVTLIAPQASLDRSPPVVDIAGRERIPVYQTRSKPLSDIITEMSSYTLTIDPDTTIDSDGNGIFDDDFSSS
jgi:hypothetical protein